MRRIFWALLKTDLRLLFLGLKDKAIDSFIWGILTIVVMAYVMPEFGLKNFGAFQAATIIIGVIGFETNFQLYNLASSIEHRKHLFYLFTLPVPSSVIFLQKAVLFTINGLILSLMMLPAMKLILGNELNLMAISWGKLAVILIVSSFLFSSLTLFLLVFVKRADQVEHMFMRVLFPMWFLGGFQFSWHALYKLNPYFGYLGLLSPDTYAHEAVRAAMLGPEGFLPFWLCIGVMCLCSVAFGGYGYTRVRRRLDLT